MIITPERAKSSKIGHIFDEYPKFFKLHDRSVDYILWVYIVYEKLQGEKSFFYPYFQALGEPELLMD